MTKGFTMDQPQQPQTQTPGQPLEAPDSPLEETGTREGEDATEGRPYDGGEIPQVDVPTETEQDAT